MAAYGYLRKSSMPTGRQTLSPEAQEREIRALAKRHGDNGKSLTLLADWDISGQGKYTAKRAGYQALVAAVESGRASAVYSYSLSRLGRSVAELARFFEVCAARSVPVRLVADAVDTSTASGRLTLNVLASVAQFEAEVTSERMLAIYAAKRAKGMPTGTARNYGDGDGEDADAVLVAFREAGSYSGAARLLNERGIKPRNAKPRRIKRSDGSTNDQEQAVWWPSSVATVIHRLDPTVKRTRRGAKAAGVDMTLAGLLRCPTCGTSLTGLRDRLDGKNKGRVRYACRLGSVVPHPRVSVSEHLIMPAIRAEADRFRPRTEAGALRPDADEAKRAALEAKRTDLLDLVGTFPKAEIERRAAAIDLELEHLEVADELINIPERIPWNAPPRELNALLRTLWARIEVDAETFQPVRYEWRLPAEYVAL